MSICTCEEKVTSKKNVKCNTVTSPQRHLLFTSWVSPVTSEKLTQSLLLRPCKTVCKIGTFYKAHEQRGQPVTCKGENEKRGQPVTCK